MSSRNPQTQKLISIIEPVLAADGYELVDVRFLLDQGGWVLRVCVDLPLDDSVDPSEVPPDRVDLEDCTKISHELSAVLDVDDPIPQAYSLEVSSPGIDRPLRTARHFEYFAGSEAKIQLAIGVATPAGERKNFKGRLAGMTGDKVALDVDGARYELPLEDIDSAKLVPDWDAVMAGKSGVGAPKPKPHKPGAAVAKRAAERAPGSPKKLQRN